MGKTGSIELSTKGSSVEVQEYLTSKGYDYNIVQRPSGLTAIMNCPKCGDREKKFGISLVNGAFSCLHENKCGWTGGYADFQRFHGDQPKRVVGDTDYKNNTKVEYDLPKHDPNEADQEVYDFFSGRGISKEIVDRFKIGKLRTAIAFRYYEDGVVVNIKYRGLQEKKFHQEKNAKPVLYGRDLVPTEAQELIIVEGEIDCLSYHQYGYAAVVSIPSGATDTRWVEYNWDWLERFKKIYLSYDMDDAGRGMIEKIAKRLGDYRVYDLRLPEKDANKCLVDGIEKSEITNRLLTAVGFDRPEIKNVAMFAERVVETLTKPDEHSGRVTGSVFLDNYLRGWRDSEITIWTGRSGSGKTTMVMQFVVQDIIAEAEAGRTLPVCIGSFEMKPEMLLAWAVAQAHRILNQKKGIPWQSAAIKESEIRDILKTVFANLYIIDIKDRVREDTVLSLMEFAAKKYGCRVFVIDSLMRVSLTNNENKLEAQLGFMDAMAKFADSYDTHIHLVAHPRKGEKDSDQPDKGDVKGASEITDIAHNVISIYRMTEEQREKYANARDVLVSTIPTTILTIHKNRAEGIIGQAKMVFDFDTKTFVEK